MKSKPGQRKRSPHTESASARKASPLGLDLNAAHAFSPLDKQSYEPLYAQIEARLRQQIQSGQLGPGDPLPGEAELSRIFGISRMTSRQALQGLTKAGLAYRERGRGTFVSPIKVEKQISHLLGFSAEMKLLGMRAGTRVLASEVIPAVPAVASALQLQPNDRVMRLHRLRLADGEPIAIEEVWLPQKRFNRLDKVDFSQRSLYSILRDHYGVTIGSAREIIEARGATREEAQLLRIAARSSLLVVSRTLLDSDDLPVEMAHSVYRGDRYRAVLSIPAIDRFSQEELPLARHQGMGAGGLIV